MNKKILAAGLAVLLLMATGCGAEPAGSAGSQDSSVSAASENGEACIEQGLAYLEQFAQGDFDGFYENVTAEFAGKVPKETFALQWAQISQAVGKQEEILSKTAAPQDGRTVVQITAVHVLRKTVNTFAFDGDGKISGSFVQYAPLDTAPQSTDGWEEVSVQVGAGDKKLNGLLTLPKNVEKPPVFLLLQGSGPSNMDEKNGAAGNKPFADIAHGLAQRGIASLRYDKRSYAYPEDLVNAGVEAEYLDDAKAALQLLLQEERVDGGKILLLGHSQGGMLGPEIVRQNPEIKGFVSLAGTLRGLEDLMLEQTEKALAASPLAEAQKQAQLQETEKMVQQVKSLDAKDTSTVIAGLPAVYWNSLKAIDTAALAGRMEIPVLVLQGEADFQVSPTMDYTLWQKTLEGKANASFRLYPKLNHLFMEGGSSDRIDMSVYDAPAHVDGQVIEDIANWALAF